MKTAANEKGAFNTLLLVQRDSAEWDYMWDKLSKHRLNKSLGDPTIADNFGEIWQYMQSEPRRFGGYLHVFRHRLHPVTCGPKCLTIKSSKDLVIEPN